jgi:hydrogenase maturation protease
MRWPQPVRVVGVGSPYGDDALAWELVRRLESQVDGQTGPEFHVVAGGQRLLDVLDGRGSLILVDALAPAGAPGTIYRFEWPDPRIIRLRPGSTHDLGPAEALQLADTLGLLPSKVVIFGLEGVHLEPGTDVSPAVATSMPELVRRVVSELAIDRDDSDGVLSRR